MACELYAPDAQKNDIHLQISVGDAATSGDFGARALAAGNLIQRKQDTQGSSGAGLGLALVLTILEAHGGRLELTNPASGSLKAGMLFLGSP